MRKSRRTEAPLEFQPDRHGRVRPAPGDWEAPLPHGIFLDTSVVAYLESFGEEIWENAPIDGSLPEQQREQIAALRVLMTLSSRAGLAIAVSPEVIRQAGGLYVREIARHWEVAQVKWGIEERGLAPMSLVATLPVEDQLVIAQAYRSGCEVVLTNDLKWVRPRHRRTIAAMGMEAHTPASLVQKLRPWLALWL